VIVYLTARLRPPCRLAVHTYRVSPKPVTFSRRLSTGICGDHAASLSIIVYRGMTKTAILKPVLPDFGCRPVRQRTLTKRRCSNPKLWPTGREHNRQSRRAARQPCIPSPSGHLLVHHHLHLLDTKGTMASSVARGLWTSSCADNRRDDHGSGLLCTTPNSGTKSHYHWPSLSRPRYMTSKQ